MTIGTGFVGRSSLGENLEPKHLVNVTRDRLQQRPERGPAVVRRARAVGAPAEPVPPYPRGEQPRAAAGRRLPTPDPVHTPCPPQSAVMGTSELREELRRLIIEELTHDHQGLTPMGQAELRSFIFLDQLQPQTMCYLGTWIKGSLPRSDMAAQIIEVAPGLDIEPLTDVALKNTDVQAGILVVERQFGYLEIHSRSTEAVRSASAAVLDALDASAADATRPTVLASRIVSRIDAQHAFLINRNKLGSMALRGRVAVRAGDAAGVVRDPRDQRGREGRATSRSSTTG